MKIFSSACLFLCCILFISCSQGRGLVGSESLEREWMLKSLPGASYKELVRARAQINLSNIHSAQAFGGCNRIFFTVKKSSGNSIEFSGIGSTKMYCVETMKVEQALINTLPLIKKYDLSGHQIAFKDGSGNVIVTAVAADWD